MKSPFKNNLKIGSKRQNKAFFSKIVCIDPRFIKPKYEK